MPQKTYQPDPTRKYPLFRRNLRLEEFYKKKEEENARTFFGNHTFTLKQFSVVFFSIILVGTILVSANLIQLPQDIRGKAASENVIQLYLFPNTLEVKKGEHFTIYPKLVGPQNKNIGTILLTIRFDPSLVRMTSMESPKESDSFSILKFTTYDDANKRGIKKILFGAKNIDAAASSTLSFPGITFQSVKEGESKINISQDSQVVFISQERATVQVEKEVTVRSKHSPTLTSKPIIPSEEPTKQPLSTPSLPPSADSPTTKIESSPTPIIPTQNTAASPSATNQ